MFVAMLKRLALPVFVFGAIYAFATAAQAMCLYNNTSMEIDVVFDCGIFCNNTWDTQPGNSYCRPSTSGTVDTDWICCSGDGAKYPAVQIHVDAHGYVVVTQPSSSEISVCSYHADDSLDSCQDFTLTG
jgi:hypothetical protein